MPTIKVADIAWGRLQSPDLDVAEEFLTDFGMVRAARTGTALYMRGTDPSHHLHVTELGPSAMSAWPSMPPARTTSPSSPRSRAPPVSSTWTSPAAAGACA